jgi:ATP-dependent DNA ligase
MRRSAPHSGQRAGARLHDVAFDLLELDGEDLRGCSWRERDAQLRELVAGSTPSITAIDTLPVTADLHRRVVALSFEGSVLKRVDAPYRAGRSRTWLKHKARHIVTAHVRAITVNCRPPPPRAVRPRRRSAMLGNRTKRTAWRRRRRRLLPPRR